MNLYGVSESVLTSGVVLRRDELPSDHPQSWESLWLAQHGSLDKFPYEKFNKYGGHYLIQCAHCHQDMEDGTLGSEDVSV